MKRNNRNYVDSANNYNNSNVNISGSNGKNSSKQWLV